MPETKGTAPTTAVGLFLWKNKRNIGILIIILLEGMKVFFPDVFTPEQMQWIYNIALGLGGVGLFHNVYNNVPKKTKE